MDDAAGRRDRLGRVALLDAFEAVPQADTTAEHDRHLDEVEGVDEVGSEEVAEHGRATSDADIEIAGGPAHAINAAVEVLGDPWAMLVLRDIMFGNRRHFRELVAALMDELREIHLGVPRPDPDAPRPSERLRAAYDAAMRSVPDSSVPDSGVAAAVVGSRPWSSESA